MNPLLILILILVFSNNRKSHGYIPGSPFRLGRSPLLPMSFSYFDTFKMELLLDRLHTITEALEKLNHLRQIQHVPPSKESSMARIQDSLDAAKGFLADTKAQDRLDALSNTLAGVKQLGNMESLISSMGPILSMLSSPPKDES